MDVVEIHAHRRKPAPTIYTWHLLSFLDDRSVPLGVLMPFHGVWILTCHASILLVGGRMCTAVTLNVYGGHISGLSMPRFVYPITRSYHGEL